MNTFCLTRAAVASIFALSIGVSANADATGDVPDKFKSDTYIEADYENFCTGQSSKRGCISVTIKNSSRSKADVITTKDPSGSLTGSGAILGFQVFEAPGCVTTDQIDSNLRQHVSSEEGFARRMRQESLHYWRDGREKKIKVLKGCTYAIALKRKDGHHNWHYSYIPPSARNGCVIDYRYITSKADLKSYERWATFGALGGEGAAGLTGLINGGFFTGASYYAQLTGLQETVAGQTMMETALENGVLMGGETVLILVVATAAYEAGVWGVFGLDSLKRIVDGKRDFVLGKDCY